jgi:hypothetical protein
MDKRVKLNTLTPDTPYAKLQYVLTDNAEIDLGLWRVTRISATLLHRAMASYRNDIPQKGLGIDFYIKGFETNFIVQEMLFTVEAGKKGKMVVSGLGTENIMVKGELGGQEGEIAFFPLGTMTTRHGDVLNRFRIVLPIDLDKDLAFLRITGENMSKPNIRFVLAWNFE